MDSTDDLNWEDIFNVDLMSLDEERDTSPHISNYILKNNPTERISINFKQLDNDITFFYNSDSLLIITLKNENWVDEIEHTQTKSRYPGEIFPEILNINEFIFLVYELSNLTDNQLINTYFTDEWLINSLNNFEESTFDLIDTLIYFGLVHYKEENYDNKYYFSDIFIDLAKKNNSEKYLNILKIITKSETCKELLTIQHYTNFDNLTKSIMLDKLSSDPNIVENKKSREQKKKIVNNFRKWYLDINSFLK